MFSRWSDGPRVNGVEPILVIFDDIKEKELIWNKLRDNLQTKTNVVVTQDSSTKRMKKTSVASKSDIGGPPRSPRKVSEANQNSNLILFFSPDGCCETHYSERSRAREEACG